MQVQVDNVWASPSTLHMRVTVWGPGQAWRHKYECSVPIAEIPTEALEPLLLTARDEAWREDLNDVPLF